MTTEGSLLAPLRIISQNKRAMEELIHINISRLDTGDYLATTREFKEVNIIGNNIFEALNLAKAQIREIEFRQSKK